MAGGQGSKGAAAHSHQPLEDSTGWTSDKAGPRAPGLPDPRLECSFSRGRRAWFRKELAVTKVGAVGGQTWAQTPGSAIHSSQELKYII